MTKGETIQRFLEPAIKQWQMYLLGMGVMASWFVFDIFSVWIFKYVGTAIENKDVAGIKDVLITYSIVFVLFYIRKYFIRL